MDENELQMDVEVIEVEEDNVESNENESRNVDSAQNNENSRSSVVDAVAVQTSNYNDEPESDEGTSSRVCDHCKQVITDKGSPNKTRRVYLDEEDDEGRLCPICFDIWTNSGEHRVCTLRCGHLFGHSCLLRWLQGQRTCPTCKSAVRKTDIRFIYARKLIAHDTAELNMLTKQLADQRTEKNKLELQRIRDTFVISSQKEEIKNLKMRLKAAETALSTGESSHGSQTTKLMVRLFKQGEVKVAKDGGCRVMAYSAKKDVLAVSMMNKNALYPGFGVRKIILDTLQATSYSILHTKPIRDLSYHPQRSDWLLSVSLDKKVRMVDDTSWSSVMSVSSEQSVWSCCWDTADTNYFYAGMSNGSISKYDIRKTDTAAIPNVVVPNDLSPVVSLSSTSVGLLVCKLCSCWVLERWPQADDAAGFPGQCLPLEGPFVSMCYDTSADNLLLSSRSNQNCPYSRHTVCKVSRVADAEVSCVTVQEFPGAPMQKLMTRSCQVNIGNEEVLVAANQEAQRAVHLWSVSSGKQMASFPAHEPALDLAHVRTGNQHHLAVLNEYKLCMYKIEIS